MKNAGGRQEVVGERRAPAQAEAASAGPVPQARAISSTASSSTGAAAPAVIARNRASSAARRRDDRDREQIGDATLPIAAAREHLIVIIGAGRDRRSYTVS